MDQTWTNREVRQQPRKVIRPSRSRGGGSGTPRLRRRASRDAPTTSDGDVSRPSKDRWSSTATRQVEGAVDTHWSNVKAGRGLRASRFRGRRSYDLEPPLWTAGPDRQAFFDGSSQPSPGLPKLKR